MIAPMPWKLTVRAGPRVEHSTFAELDDALAAAEARAQALADDAPREPVDVKYRTYEPVQQVAARIELAGPQRFFPRTQAGLDVRGDGSTEAYLGRVRRRLVDQRTGESPYRALRRAIAGQTKA